MAVQDLTPQLRTRLSRVERAVGWFVMLATLLILSGFVFYVHHTAKRKGWFLTKVRYFTLTETAVGLKLGDPVKLMGFDVGEITRIDAQPPGDIFNVYVEFKIKSPYYGYLWAGMDGGSRARVTPSDFLGKRAIEVTKGTNGVPTYLELEFREYSLPEAQLLADLKNKVLAQEIRTGEKNEVLYHALREPLSKGFLEKISALGLQKILVADRLAPSKIITGIWDDHAGIYRPYTKESSPYWLPAEETAALTERLEAVVNQVEKALPGIFDLTNQVATVLANTSDLEKRASTLIASVQPVVTNLAAITALLTNSNGSFGEWLIPTNTKVQLDQTLASANSTLSTVDTNVAVLAASLGKTLENLANITSNLNAQVRTNDQILSRISSAVVHSDEMMQGLKRHWLLRSAFREKATNPPPRKAAPPKRGK